jgi:hypothetical protein
MDLTFAFSETSRVLNDWRRDRRNTAESVWAAVRRYARKHGAAGVYCADDSYILFYTEDGKLRQKTWPSARPVYFNQPT